ncbi:MAG: hypothetical protein IJW16_05375 [Clostridia bacterium]|nr:hypothetical protein [Clostridia bacterium]
MLTKIEFPQAKDVAGTPAHHYELQLLDRNNAILKNETVFGGYYLPTVVEKNTYSIALSTTNEKYILRITPISIFGQRGEPMIQWIKVEAPVVAPEAIGDPDLLQVQVQGGAVVDLSGKNYTTDTRGTTNVSGEYFSFGNNGNIKFTDFKQNDTKLADGFAFAIVAKLGDVNTKQTIAGNQHAGGYGMSVEAGKASFAVHVNGRYVAVTCAVTANTEYHIVGVYNPDVGVLLYLNGQLVGVAAVGDNPQMGFATDAGAEYFCVGADSDASGNGEIFYKGSIKQVGIYSTPLTAGNVLYLYQNQ